ncbi:response regulator transcription factor [Kineococcus rhizosphaerae]|uniref:DNA-binding response OmpR family regulator n=1 Tax=Kineococcus rhizosphaerae TaxID=559628 RepID=A0A2T0QYJ9_9ACTN|nr:response regulator transcription factor [Kineococcus rhizosphaerae]PRY11457.1 DNA-binding response OmpR family regulator [Kineococcus rhizosphaerae]
MPTAAVRVLLVEDDPLIAESVTEALTGTGMVVRARPDGRDLDEVVEHFRPDIAVLDVMLPGEDGTSLARRVCVPRDVPVVFVTARDDIDDRLSGFAAGADDYVVKPFAVEELLVRLRAVLRRSGRTPQVVEVGDLVVDESAAVALRAGVALDLTATEFRLLAQLVRHRGRTLSKLQLLTQVWGYEHYDQNLVEVHVSALRRKLEEHGPRLVHTVRGLGYVLRVPTASPTAPTDGDG